MRIVNQGIIAFHILGRRENEGYDHSWHITLFSSLQGGIFRDIKCIFMQSDCISVSATGYYSGP